MTRIPFGQKALSVEVVDRPSGPVVLLHHGPNTVLDEFTVSEWEQATEIFRRAGHEARAKATARARAAQLRRR
jgi:hypothetical protein